MSLVEFIAWSFTALSILGVAMYHENEDPDLAVLLFLVFLVVIWVGLA